MRQRRIYVGWFHQGVLQRVAAIPYKRRHEIQSGHLITRRTYLQFLAEVRSYGSSNP